MKEISISQFKNRICKDPNDILSLKELEQIILYDSALKQQTEDRLRASNGRLSHSDDHLPAITPGGICIERDDVSFIESSGIAATEILGIDRLLSIDSFKYSKAIDEIKESNRVIGYLTSPDNTWIKLLTIGPGDLEPDYYRVWHANLISWHLMNEYDIPTCIDNGIGINISFNNIDYPLTICHDSNFCIKWDLFD